MELDLTTFVLEIVNFLILIWILKHFLYRPVLAVIERRRSTVQETLERARHERQEAEALKRDYEEREARWQQEREAARSALDDEMAARRKQALEALSRSLDRERDRQRAAAERDAEDLRLNLERRALSQGATFTARLLSRFASPQLEQQLIELALADLGALDTETRQRLNGVSEPARVSTAHPLDETARSRLREAVEDVLGPRSEWEFLEAPELLAGLRLDLGAWVLQANLRDELAYFAEVDDA